MTWGRLDANDRLIPLPSTTSRFNIGQSLDLSLHRHFCILQHPNSACHHPAYINLLLGIPSTIMVAVHFCLASAYFVLSPWASTSGGRFARALKLHEITKTVEEWQKWRWCRVLHIFLSFFCPLRCPSCCVVSRNTCLLTGTSWLCLKALSFLWFGCPFLCVTCLCSAERTVVRAHNSVICNCQLCAKWFCMSSTLGTTHHLAGFNVPGVSGSGLPCWLTFGTATRLTSCEKWSTLASMPSLSKWLH